MPPRRGDPVRDEALVVRSIRYRESSRIVTLFSAEHGKFAVIAKGARRSRSGSALSAVEPPARVETMVYFRSTRSVQTLGQVTVLDTYHRIRNDLTLTGYALATLQLLERTTTDGEPNPNAYRAAVDALENLSSRETDPRLELWRFMLDLLRAVGFGIDPLSCPVCGRPTAEIGRHNLLVADAGAVCCHRCTPPEGTTIPVSGESISIMRRLSRDSRDRLNNLKVSENARRELTDALERFLKYHQPHLGELTALHMLDALERPIGRDKSADLVKADRAHLT